MGNQKRMREALLVIWKFGDEYEDETYLVVVRERFSATVMNDLTCRSYTGHAELLEKHLEEVSPPMRLECPQSGRNLRGISDCLFSRESVG